MNFKINDFVTRNSYDNDIVFQIISINQNVAVLKGVEVRLMADSFVDDLLLFNNDDVLKEDRLLTNNALKGLNLNRSEYFYLPGKILHIDGDKDYLERCIKFYTELKVEAYGIYMKESDMPMGVISKIKEYNPDILVITGHDAYFNKKSESKNAVYQNSSNFIDAVKAARKVEVSHDKLIIIAGACQSNYEELIKAGANFASSPKRINIHALDPAIIASSISLSERNKNIDLISIIEKTKYGTEGVGGIITNGTMYVGYPR